MPREAPQQLELDTSVAQRARQRRSDKRRTHRPARPSPAQLLCTPGALLTRSHLRQLGLERRAVDAVFRMLPVVALPGYSRPMIRAEQYRELLEQHTYRDDRVRPMGAGIVSARG